jgi:hypothetical protein
MLVLSLSLVAASCGSESAVTNDSKNEVKQIVPAPSPHPKPPTPTNEIKVEPLKTESSSPALTPTSDCDPNYSGCVPIASDVDCLGGTGNGPAYVKGPVHVTGSDIYDLDRDGDGVGCDK